MVADSIQVASQLTLKYLKLSWIVQVGPKQPQRSIRVEKWGRRERPREMLV